MLEFHAGATCLASFLMWVFRIEHRLSCFSFRYCISQPFRYSPFYWKSAFPFPNEYTQAHFNSMKLHLPFMVAIAYCDHFQSISFFHLHNRMLNFILKDGAFGLCFEYQLQIVLFRFSEWRQSPTFSVY